MTPHSIRTHEIGEFLAVRLQPQFVLCAANGLIGSDGLEIATRFGVEDSLLRAGALALKAEAEAGSPGGRLYAESVGTALAVHLVRRYSMHTRSTGEVTGGLSRIQLRGVVDFIHAHIDEEISLSVLASVAGLSPFHFTRLFKRSTGLAPHRFVIRCRVEKAKELLQAQRPLVDIALSVGFCNQSHLAEHFKRAYGMTPKTFRQQMCPRKIPVSG
jgi:AraC family transcriptional regulator